MSGTALVTGAASGIGEAAVVKLAASRWTVAAVDIDPDGPFATQGPFIRKPTTATASASSSSRSTSGARARATF